MKKMVTVAIASLISMSAFAGTYTVSSMPKADATMDVSRVADSIALGSNQEKDITVRLVSLDLGKSTDVSPRKALYITYFHAGEINNTRTAFKLADVFSLEGTKRISAGVYEITVVDTELKKQKYVVDTAQTFADDRNLKLEDFQDPYFKSTIKVTE